MARIGIILCNCFGEIGNTIGLESVKTRLESDPAVDSVTIVESLCLPGDTASARSLIRERGIGKVLIVRLLALRENGVREGPRKRGDRCADGAHGASEATSRPERPSR